MNSQHQIPTPKPQTAQSGFSLTERMVVLVIIGVLVLLALPKLLPVVTKAKTTEAKLMLKQIYTLEQSYKFENDKYSQALNEIGFVQEKLVSQGGQARYKICSSIVVLSKKKKERVALVHCFCTLGVYQSSTPSFFYVRQYNCRTTYTEGEFEKYKIKGSGRDVPCIAGIRKIIRYRITPVAHTALGGFLGTSHPTNAQNLMASGDVPVIHEG